MVVVPGTGSGLCSGTEESRAAYQSSAVEEPSEEQVYSHQGMSRSLNRARARETMMKTVTKTLTPP